jgi:anti-sigma factor RsiW
MSCEHTDDAGAWVLGALPEDEQRRFAAHLETCEICRREVAELQMVADTLPLAAVQVAPPPELKDRIMSAVRAEAEVLRASGPEADVVAREPAPAEEAGAAAAPAERKRKPRDQPWWRRPLFALRPVPAAFAAAGILALGIAFGALVSGGGPSEHTVRAQVVAPAAPGARAALTVTGDRATLDVRNFPSPPSGRVYQVWLKRPGRAAPEPTNALFDVRDGTASVAVPGGVKGVDQVLVTAEPNGGSAAPTRPPVVIAQAA